MRKLKLLLAACALFGVTATVWADDEDYTDRITNANLSSKEGWTFEKTGSKDWSAVAGSEPSYVIEAYAGWGGFEITAYSMKQNVTLPSGKYRAEGYAFYRYGAGATDAPTKSDAKFVAGVFSSPVATLGGISLDETLTDYPNSVDEASAAFTKGYYKNQIEFAIESESTIAFGYEGTHNELKSWFIAGPIKLYRTGDFDYSLYQTQLENLVGDVKALQDKDMSSDASSALAAVVSNYDGQSCSSVAAYEAAYEEINNAISKANKSIANYAIVKTGIIPTNSTSGWAISTTAGSLACNGWSTEGKTDGSNMTTPFIQDWAGAGTPLGAGKLYYRLESLTPGEKYSVSALVRVLDETGAAVSGATFYVNGETKDIATAGSACTNGIAGTMNLAAEVDENGVLEIGIESASTATFNWMSIKDVTIAVFAGIKVSNIELSQTSATLIAGDGLTLTANVTPENADDKTITWSSSDESIAKVTATGIVSAVGSGTATITATANDGSGTSASCEVTVNYAEAPSYYSEEIAGGTDYYILNVATGKFLGGGNDWGTHASLIEHGIPFTVAAVGDNKYTFDSHTYNNQNDHFLNGTYIDAASTNLYVVSLGDGKFSISTGDGSAFIAVNAGSTYVENKAGDAESPLAQWYFLSKTDRDKMLASASTSSPADATYYIKEANISRNLRVSYGKSGWTNIAYGEDKNQDNANFNAQVWNGTVNVSQTIENIPNGTYTLNMQGFSSGTDVKLKANGGEVAVLPQPGINTQADAAPHFAAKEYTNTLEVTVTDRTLTISLTGDCSGNKWLCYDNFELFMTDYTPISSLSADIDKAEIAVAETATITATVDPENASFNKALFESSDEEVATVDANGVVSAIAPGTATITVTDELKENSTTIDVTVVEAGDYPETEYATESYTNDGATRNIVTLSDENIIKNGAFEYPNTFYGWKAGNNADMSEAGFDVITEDGNTYIKSKKGEGGGNPTAIKTVWPIESGKTYVFGYKIKGNAGNKTSWTATSLTNTIGDETEMIEREFDMTGDWQEKKYMFINDKGYSYLQFFARWYDAAFDDFYLAEVVSSTTEGNVDYAIEAAPTANIGDGPFQYKQVDIDAAISGLVQGTSTVEEVQTAYDAIKALAINAPADGQLFNVILTYGGWTYDQKAMTYLAGDRADMGGYNIKYNAPANQNLAQAFTFTKVEGNNYKMSQIDADGVARYISTGVPYSGNTSQIRTTTNADDALLVTVIPTNTEGVWNLMNTEANNYIGSQDAGVYTVNSHIDFNIVETTKPSIAISTTAAGYGTTMLPFAVAELPSGVKAYTCAAIDGSTLTLVEVTALEANKPYIIEGAWENDNLTGDAQGTALTYTEGLLTGVYAQTDAPVGSYVLQNQESVVGFYKVAEGEGKQPQVKANHVYLSVPSEARALYFNNATAIRAIEALTSGEVEIYNAAGARQNSLQKGVNIIKQGNKTVKVMVK